MVYCGEKKCTKGVVIVTEFVWKKKYINSGIWQK